jgi:oligopeptide transport system substrate-binding protein
MMNDDGSYTAMYLMGEGLTRNNAGTIVPGAAASWDVSDDGLTYTFHLQDNLMWSDGSPLTAGDFLYSFQRLINPELANTNATTLLGIKNAEAYYNGEADLASVGIAAPDDQTVVLTLEQTDIEILYVLASYAAFPISQAKVEAAGAAYGSEADTILTSGAFTLSEWAHEDRQVLVKNPYYWNKDAVKLDKITRRVGIAEQTAADMLQAGELDSYGFSDYSIVTSLTDLGYTVFDYDSTYSFTHMNSAGGTDESAPFMANVNFRRALNYAVNREGLVASVYPGLEAADRLTAPSMMGVSDTFQNEYPYQGWSPAGDPEKAKECLNLALDELGMTLDDVPTLSMLCFDSQRSTLCLQAIQDMFLTTLGIEAVVDAQPIQQMLSKVMNGEFDLWWGGNPTGMMDWLSSDSFAANYLRDDPGQVLNYNLPDYAALYDAAKAAATLQDRKDRLFEMEQFLCENPGSILIGWGKLWEVYQTGLTGITQHGVTDYTFADIDQ